MGQIKLNLGAGDTVIDGWTAVDRKTGGEVYPLKYADNSVDEIRASHVLEHFPLAEVERVVQDWVRSLKPGGRIRIAVPDVDKIVASKAHDGMWARYLIGGHTDENDYHYAVFDENLLRQVMHNAGLENIQKWEGEGIDSASLPISLNLEGAKPVSDTMDLKIKAMMSVPRYGQMASRGVIETALRQFGMPLYTSQGVYWGQCMQRAFERAIEEGVDWALTLDYDSVFTAQDLSNLIERLAQSPEIDCLAALQPRRGSDYPLFTQGDATQCAVEDMLPFKVTTAHFGLTLIRMEDLEDVPKPWFWSKPQDGGTWGDDGKLDDDIYFWHVWRQAGKNIYVDPNVRIGHVEERVAYFDDQLGYNHMHVDTWRKKFVKDYSDALGAVSPKQ